ncbi:MAG: hypothetical protein V4510_04760 [bacterium]
MTPTSTPAKQFWEHVAPFASDLGQFDIRAWVSENAQAAPNAGFVVVLTCRSLPASEAGTNQIPPSAGPFTFHRTLIPANSLGQFLDDLANGFVRLEGRNYSLLTKEGRPPAFYYAIRDAPGSVHGLGFQLAAQPDRPDSARLQLEEMDRILQTANPPWDGVGEVLSEFFQYGMQAHELTYRSHVLIEARPGVGIIGGALTGRELRLYVSATENTDVNLMFIGYIVPPSTIFDMDVIRGRLPVRSVLAGQSPSDIVMSIELPREASRAKIVVTYRGWPVATASVVTAPVGAARRHGRSLVALKENEGFLKDMIDQGLKGQGMLETWTALALHCLGMRVMPVWAMKWDAPDVLAEGDGWHLVVECTTGTPDKDNKLAKLVRRRAEIANAVGQPILAALVTPLSRKAISESDLATAHGDEISLLGHEDMLELSTLATSAAGPRDLREFLERRAR